MAEILHSFKTHLNAK